MQVIVLWFMIGESDCDSSCSQLVVVYNQQNTIKNNFATQTKVVGELAEGRGSQTFFTNCTCNCLKESFDPQEILIFLIFWDKFTIKIQFILIKFNNNNNNSFFVGLIYLSKYIKVNFYIFSLGHSWQKKKF